MRIVDLFCGAGGAAMGYHQAWPGAEIVGVDIAPQPRYPFAFVQADAMTYPLDGFDFIHASPPCQGYSRMRHLPWLKDREYPLLLADTWERLDATGTAWAIENVEDAPMPSSIVLCGRMFGLPMFRHRRFGTSSLLLTPAHPRHTDVIHAGRRNLATRYRQGGGRDVAGLFPGTTASDVGLGWMSQREASQAIPPAYTRFIGEQLTEAVAA